MSWSWRKILHSRALVRSYFRNKLGDGKITSAWFDNWCDYSPLIDYTSPRQIVRAGFQLNAKVTDLIANREWIWPRTWPGCFSSIQVPLLIENKHDEVVWMDRLGKEHNFSVGAVWNTIRPRDVEVGWYKIVWFSHAIPRHAFLLWLILKRKLKTQDMLKLWDITGMDPTMLVCPLCRTQPDSHNHLFFECAYSSQVWSKVKARVDLHQVTSSWDSVVNGVMSYGMKRSMYGITAKLVLAASVYFIWQERNTRFFQGKRRSFENLANIILATVRMKLLSFRFKNTSRWEQFKAVWELPSTILSVSRT